jgi:hypothetical protein
MVLAANCSMTGKHPSCVTVTHVFSGPTNLQLSVMLVAKRELERQLGSTYQPLVQKHLFEGSCHAIVTSVIIYFSLLA